MGKTIYAKILTLALACTMVFAGIAMAAVAETDLETAANLFENGSFETYILNEDGTTVKSVSGVRVLTSWELDKTSGVGGSACLKSNATSGYAYTWAITNLEVGRVIEVTASVKAPSTAKVYMQAIPAKDSVEVAYAAQTNTYTGAEATADNWSKIALRVPLVKDANGLVLRFFGRTAVGALIDDVTVKYAPDNNLLINGDFETIDPLDATKPFAWGATEGTIDTTQVSSGYCVKINAGKTITLPNIYSAIGAVYRLSFRYTPGESGGSPKVYLDQEGNTAGFSINPPVTFGEWTTVTAYATTLTTRVTNATLYLKANSKYGYFDDVTLELVENPVTVDCFAAEPTSATVGTASGHYSVYAKGGTLSAMPMPDTTVYAYMNVWDASLLSLEAVSSTKTVLLGIYKTDGTKKQLCGVAIKELTCAKKEGTSTSTDKITYTNGISAIPGTAIIPLAMPEAAGTYSIEAYVWDGVSGLTPFTSKTIVLSGTNTAVEES